MCVLNGLFLSLALWHNNIGASVEDRTRTCAYTHKSTFFKGESYNSDTLTLRNKIRLRRNIWLHPSINLGLENHRFSRYYNDLYVIAYPSIRVSTRINRGIYVDMEVSAGKGFYTLKENSEISAPNDGYSSSSALSLGISISTDAIKNERKFFNKKRKRR